jgi:hypothetical protein
MTQDPPGEVRLASIMLDLHEWLAAEVAYFEGQGFTCEQARAMAAATYVTVFGGGIGGGE